MGAGIMNKLSIYHQNIELLYNGQNNPNVEKKLLDNFKATAERICSTCDSLAYKYVTMSQKSKTNNFSWDIKDSRYSIRGGKQKKWKQKNKKPKN